VAVVLNLGCCDRYIAGAINVDICPPADVVCDLNERWPWSDSSVDAIIAHDIIEHLVDPIHTMNEMWRVLKPGGTADIIVPTTDGRGAWQDPTHVSFWNRNSFFYYEHGNPHRERFGKHYGVNARFVIEHARESNVGDGVWKLDILLRAVK